MIKVCAMCGYDYVTGTSCPHCGSRVVVVEDSEPDREIDMIKVCAICGCDYVVGTSCPHCGSRVVEVYD